MSREQRRLVGIPGSRLLGSPDIRLASEGLEMMLDYRHHGVINRAISQQHPHASAASGSHDNG